MCPFPDSNQTYSDTGGPKPVNKLKGGRWSFIRSKERRAYSRESDNRHNYLSKKGFGHEDFGQRASANSQRNHDPRRSGWQLDCVAFATGYSLISIVVVSSPPQLYVAVRLRTVRYSSIGLWPRLLLSQKVKDRQHPVKVSASGDKNTNPALGDIVDR